MENIIITVILCFILIIVLLIELKAKGVRQFIREKILEAEIVLGSEDGKLKMEYVVNSVKFFLPVFIRPFITVGLVQYVFDGVKDLLDYVPSKEQGKFSDTIYVKGGNPNV